MAYKQKGCSPITAKLKRTTKGGMVQDPLLNVGSVAKMKGDLNKDGKMSGYETARQTAIDKSMSSPAKQGGRYNKRKRVKATTSDKPKKQKEFTNMSFKEYRESGLMKPSEAKYYQGSGTKKVKNKKTTKTTKVDPKSNGGFPGVPAASNVKTNPLSKGYQFPKKETPKKGKITGAIGSDLRRQQYKERGWADDATTKKEKATVKAKPGKIKQIKIEGPSTKLAATKTKPKAKEVSKAKANKLTRAAGVRAKGEAALASGNVRKARRLKRREERIKKRAARK